MPHFAINPLPPQNNQYPFVTVITFFGSFIVLPPNSEFLNTSLVLPVIKNLVVLLSISIYRFFSSIPTILSVERPRTLDLKRFQLSGIYSLYTPGAVYHVPLFLYPC